MASFSGFPGGKVRLTPVPAPFFTDLLPEIDDLAELKITLYALWFLDRQEGKIRYFTLADCLQDHRLEASFGQTEEAAQSALAAALERAVTRGTLIRAQLSDGSQPGDILFFLNSPRGRAAALALEKGEWTPGAQERAEVALDLERPNIYTLYEENIGPLTPMMVETLRDAEQEYPHKWIEEAVRAAVENNARRWRYVEVILRARKEKGHHDANRRNPEEDRRRYIEGEFADFIEH